MPLVFSLRAWHCRRTQIHEPTPCDVLQISGAAPAVMSLARKTCPPSSQTRTNDSLLARTHS
eukprot:8230002-Alexandrium_andersonii.AAC.1